MQYAAGRLMEEIVVEFVAGIDGGGTKTKLVCQDLSCGMAAERRFGAFNLNGIGQEGFQHLLTEITAYLHTLGHCRSVCIGAAGCSNPEMRRIVAESFQRAGITRWKLVGDHEIALYGALEGKAGLCLIAGTGSICCARDREGGVLRLGGWGHLIGDQGSAYALGRDAFAAVARQLDGLGPETMLTGLLMAAFQLETRGDVISFVYQGGKSHIARAAELVEQAYAEGDALAAEILEDNVQSLVELVAAAASRSNLREAPLALMGGMLEHDTAVRRLFVSRLAEVRADLQCIRPRQSAAAGAVMMALSDLVPADSGESCARG